MKLVEIVDARPVQLTLAIGVVFPVTVLSFVGAIYGLVLGFGSLSGGLSWTAVWAPASILGLLGVIGAWSRVLSKRGDMSPFQAVRTRRLLWCGIIASAGLAVQFALFTDTRLTLTPLFIVFIIGGLGLLRATPSAP